MLKVRATGERFVPDTRHSIANSHTRQLFTPIERIGPNVLHAIWNHHARQSIALFKRLVGDANDSVGNIYLRCAVQNNTCQHSASNRKSWCYLRFRRWLWRRIGLWIWFRIWVGLFRLQILDPSPIPRTGYRHAPSSTFMSYIRYSIQRRSFISFYRTKLNT